MNESYRKILDMQEIPYEYAGMIQEIMGNDPVALIGATDVFLLGKIIGIRQERAKRRGERA